MTESTILGITSNALLVKEVALKYATVLELVQLFSHEFLTQCYQKTLLQVIFYLYFCNLHLYKRNAV